VSLRTEYEFTLPRGYVDHHGALHRTGIMRLATARDELEPLRDPTISGPDDPRLTILVLARVVTRLGSLELVTPYEIEGLFAADLAFLQDFYGVINFGTQEEYEALLAAQREVAPVGVDKASAGGRADASSGVADAESDAAGGQLSSGVRKQSAGDATASTPDRGRRHAIEEIPAGGR
jgi:hypothetical protein